jgi:D-alanine-D-alanine ligase-like ATP-grasp enzyme
MKIAFTHNLKLTEAEEEAEFDTVETVDAIANALAAGGHEVEKIEVSGPASHLAARIEAFAPDLIFNTAEGRRGRAREAFYPALFEELNYPYTGSDAYVLTVTLDKWLTKCVLREHGIDTPKARLVTARDLPALDKIEGSSSPTTKARPRGSATTRWRATGARCACSSRRWSSSTRPACSSRSSSPAST